MNMMMLRLLWCLTLLLLLQLHTTHSILSPTESTKKFYNEHVDSYIANIDKAGVTHAPTAHLDAFGKYLKGTFAYGTNKKVLELGCGYGRDAELLAARDCHVMATDYSRNMLLKAQERIENNNAMYGTSAFSPAVHFMELDMRQVGQYFLPASFHGIWACATMLHLPKQDIPALLQSLFTLLKPGGYLYVSIKVQTKISSTPAEDETFDPDERYGGIRKFYAFYQPDEFIEYLKEAGFEIVEHGTSDHTADDDYATHPFLHVFCQKPPALQPSDNEYGEDEGVQ